MTVNGGVELPAPDKAPARVERIPLGIAYMIGATVVFAASSAIAKWQVAVYPSLRVYGYHGFVQAGIVYQILNGNVPPTSSLLAGQPGTYPWAGALVLAGISRLLGISPFWAASLVAVASLAVLLVITYRIGLLATGDAEASLFGTAVSLYAFTFTQSVPDNALKSGLGTLLPFPFNEPRGAPILEKFNGCTAFPLGLALYAVALLLLLRLAREGSPRWRAVVAFAASLLALAFVYPFFFPPMALLCVVVAVVAWRAGGPERRLAVLLAGALALVGTTVLPYYLQLKAGRSGTELQLVPLPGLVRAGRGDRGDVSPPVGAARLGEARRLRKAASPGQGRCAAARQRRHERPALRLPAGSSLVAVQVPLARCLRLGNRGRHRPPRAPRACLAGRPRGADPLPPALRSGLRAQGEGLERCPARLP